MGSSSDNALAPEFIAAFHAAADDRGFLPFEAFMDLALYHPHFGYYCRDQPRVGRSLTTDFYTATSLGPVFGELVVAAVVHQLGARDPASFTFVELGAECGRSVLDAVSHPFATVARVGVRDPLRLSGRCVVFSNELFDAQPCARFVRTAEGWDELGVTLQDGVLTESRRPAAPPSAPGLDAVPVGYQLDCPRRAAALAEQIAAQPWCGLFLAFDYGKSWRELVSETPQGTVRAYHRHRQSNQLLARPGEQDLTCHICWDWLVKALQIHGFNPTAPLAQEAFLVQNSASALAAIMEQEALRMSPRKAGLMQLLHPGALGQKFQVLSAWREDHENSPCFGSTQTFISDPFN